MTFGIRGLVISVFILSGAAHATESQKTMSSAEKTEYDAQVRNANDKNNGSVTDMKFYCGFTVPVSFTPEIVSVWSARNESGADYCNHVRLGLSAFCKEGDPAGKEARKKLLMAKIKKINCSVASEPKAIQVSFKDGTLNCKMGSKMNDNDIAGVVAEYVQKSLH